MKSYERRFGLPVCETTCYLDMDSCSFEKEIDTASEILGKPCPRGVVELNNNDQRTEPCIDCWKVKV